MKATICFLILLVGIANNLSAQTSSEIEGKIEHTVDSKTGEIFIATPALEDIQLSKFILKGKADYYLSLFVKTDSLLAKQKGVAVFFNDGSKWQKTEETIDRSEDLSEYSVFIELSKEDLKLFSSKRVAKFRVGEFEGTVEDSFAKQFMLMVDAMIKMKK